MKTTSKIISTKDYRSYVGAAKTIRFMSPKEVEFANLLERFDLPWSCEPTRFVLALHDNGTEKIAFQPDFYLPNQQLYLELTSSPYNGSAGKDKHRKVRLLSSIDSTAQVILLCQAELQELEDLKLVANSKQFLHWLENARQRMADRMASHEKRRKLSESICD